MRECRRSDLGFLSHLWRTLETFFTHLKLGGNSLPALHQSWTFAGQCIGNPKLLVHTKAGACPFLSDPQQGFASGGKNNASSSLKTIPESSQLFPKLDTVFLFPLCRIIPLFSVFGWQIQQSALVSAMSPWVFLQYNDLEGGGWLNFLLRARLRTLWASLWWAESCWFQGEVEMPCTFLKRQRRSPWQRISLNKGFLLLQNVQKLDFKGRKLPQ